MQWSGVHWIVVQFSVIELITSTWSAVQIMTVRCSADLFSIVHFLLLFSFAFCAVFYEVDWPGYDIPLRNSVIGKCIKLFHNTATWTVAITIIYIYIYIYIFFFNVGSLLNNKKFHELFFFNIKVMSAKHYTCWFHWTRCYC